MSNEKLLEIVQRAKNGEPGAFEELCQEKVHRIIYISSKLMGNLHDAEDVAQEILLRIYNDITHLQKVSSFNSWLYRMIVGECNKAKRKLYSNEEYLMGEYIDLMDETKHDFIPHEYLEETEKRDLLTKAVDRLRSKNKICVLLFYYEGMSYEEIADVLEISKKDVANLLYRSKLSIREYIEKEAGGVPTSSAVAIDSMMLGGLTKMFEMEASALPAQVVEATVAAAMVKIAAQPLVAAASTATVSANGAGAGGISIVAKAVAAVAAGAIVATSGIAVYVNVSQAQQAAPPSIVSIAVPHTPTAPPSRIFADSSLPASTETNEITTLEEMIGEREAQLLRRYVAGGASAEELDAFLEELGMIVEQKGTNVSTGEEYILYSLTRQTRLLMIIRRQTPQSGIEVAFRFTTFDEPTPQMEEIVICFEAWQQG